MSGRKLDAYPPSLPPTVGNLPLALCMNLDDNYPFQIAQEFTYFGIYIFTMLRVQSLLSQSPYFEN